jgi:7-cyano-7-deazaguanine synthase
MTDKAVILVSGGMDSATAVYEAVDRGYDPLFLHTSYGQRTEAKERRCAETLAREVDAAEFLHVETGHLAQIGTSSLTDEHIEVGEADMETEDIPTTYVPFRNANLLSMATSYAEAQNVQSIFIGAHSEDFAGYPDCRPAFFEAFQQVIKTGTKPETDISLEAPFVEWSKTEIATHGLALDVPYEHTWSCYRAEEPACGTCDSCAFRLQAFRQAGVRDPITYAQRPDYGDA